MTVTRDWLDKHLPAEHVIELARAVAPDFWTMETAGGGRLTAALLWLAAMHEADRFPWPAWKEYDPATGVHPETAWSIRIAGLAYKGEDQYLTLEGWPLGTRCWYVRVECGWREFIAAEDPLVAALRGVFYAATTKEWRDTHPQRRAVNAEAHAEDVAARIMRAACG